MIPIPIPIPKLTDNLNEPGFFAPLEEWKRILGFFTGRDLIDFYAMLEMIIKIVQEARLAKATFNMASDSNSEWNGNGLIGLVIDYDGYMTNNNNLITAFLGIAIFLLIVSTVIMYALMNATAKKSSKSKDGNKSSDKSHQQV